LFDYFLLFREADKEEDLKSISEPLKTEEFICIHNYKACSSNELTIHKDTKCYVVEKNLNGWWFIDTHDGQGYVPQCVLKSLNSSSCDLIASFKLDERNFQ
jgi:hypothetical protein